MCKDRAANFLSQALQILTLRRLGFGFLCQLSGQLCYGKLQTSAVSTQADQPNLVLKTDRQVVSILLFTE